MPPDAERLGPQAWILRGFARDAATALAADLEAVITRAPLRHMETPGGGRMSVAMTNCGRLGWTSDRRGYRYAREDPDSGAPWPAIPDRLARLAHDAAQRAGFADFTPDACLVNRYLPGARLALHQDRDERDFAAPIVSVSLGLPAVFLFGGHSRRDRPVRTPLLHGDVVVWGGEDRLRYHGVAPLPTRHPPETDLLAADLPPLFSGQRTNLTLRKAG